MEEASPGRLLRLTLAHWGIEGGLHQKRDVSLREDRGQVRTGNAAHVLASLNNVVVGLAAHLGEENLAEAQRGFGYRFDRALHYHTCGQPVGTGAAPAARAAGPAAPRLTRLKGGLTPAA